MKKIIIVLVTVLLGITVLQAQTKYSTRTGKISFYSKAPLEDITAVNNQVNGVLNATDGAMAFVVLVRSFDFEKQLMEEHFNENYLHSDKYPKSTFEGKIVNLSAVNFAKDGTYNVEVSGKLMMHGVTKDVKEKGQIIVKGNTIKVFAKFFINLADYNIKNDKVKNIAEAIEITVDTELTK